MHRFIDLSIVYKSGLEFCSTQVSNFSSNNGKVHFEGLVHLLRYIRCNLTLLLKYYADMKDANLSDLLRKAIINTKNQLMFFSDSSWQYCTDTGRSTREYIIFDQGETIDHGTNVPGPVAQSSVESEYNSAFTAGLALAHFMN